MEKETSVPVLVFIFPPRFLVGLQMDCCSVFILWRVCEVGDGEGDEEEEGRGTWYFYHDLNPTRPTKIPWCVLAFGTLLNCPDLWTAIAWIWNKVPHVFKPKSSKRTQLITTSTLAWRPNSYLDQCSSFQARCKPVSQCWRDLAEGADSPTSPHPRPRSRTCQNLMRKMAERGESGVFRVLPSFIQQCSPAVVTRPAFT